MRHIRFNFNFQKTLQASAFLLRLAGGRMDYIDFLKMLYIADRECLTEEREPITGDSVIAMKNGPVLCTVRNLIKEKNSQSEQWHRFIGTHFDQTTKQREVFAKKKIPGEDELYRYEKIILERVFKEHKDQDLVAYTHTFPEWKKYEQTLNSPNTKNLPSITIEDIIEGIGKPGLADNVKDRIADIQDYNKMFGK